jgi:hypothetical protein
MKALLRIHFVILLLNLLIVSCIFATKVSILIDKYLVLKYCDIKGSTQ